MTRKRKDHMDVGRREKFAGDVFPANVRKHLPDTSGSADFCTRAVGDGAMSTAAAFIEMTAERGSTTARNGQEHFLTCFQGDPLTASFDEGISPRSAGLDVGHLERWPTHLFSLCSDQYFSLSESSGLAVAFRWRWERCR